MLAEMPTSSVSTWLYLLPPSPGLPLVGVLGFWYMAVFMFAGLHCIACSASESNKKKRSDQTMR